MLYWQPIITSLMADISGKPNTKFASKPRKQKGMFTILHGRRGSLASSIFFLLMLLFVACRWQGHDQTRVAWLQALCLKGARFSSGQYS